MNIESKIKHYSLEMHTEIFTKREMLLSNDEYDNIFFIIDKNVFSNYTNDIKKFIKDDFYMLIDANEGNKEYVQLAEYYKELINNKFTRKDILFTIGGGILQDISGFIASTLYRGIKWFFIPTTLLSQADSCIGSKTSINFGNSKNLIGSFYPPDRIFVDSYLCNTLTDEYFNSGIGEIIKFHILSDNERYTLLKKFIFSDDLRNSPMLNEIILSTLEIKKSYFEEDEFDTGRRNLLNYGHCFGHALESASNFEICHGEAVIVGMGFANLLSLKREILSRERYDEFEKILIRHYPKFDLSSISVNSIIEYLKRDKKRIGKDLTMVLCKDIGDFIKANDVKESEIMSLYTNFKELYANLK